MFETYLLEVVRGKRRRLQDYPVLLFLSVLEGVYRAAVAVRNGLYRLRILPSRRLPVPVISIGNLAAGGTGKTPLSIYLARLLRSAGRRPGVLLRGYRGKGEGVRLVHPLLPVADSGDEARLLARSLPGCPVVVGADRYLAGLMAIENCADILLLDDGLQHLALRRDLEIILLHAANPWENGHLLPRGLLREGKKGLRRADLIVLTGIENVAVEELDELAAEVRRRRPGVPVVRMATKPVAVQRLSAWLREEADGQDPREFLNNLSVGAFTAVARPEKFFRTLADLGAKIERTWTRPDHASWENADFLAAAGRSGTEEELPLLTTEKDAVKLDHLLDEPVCERIYVLRVTADFSEEDKALLVKKLEELKT